MGRTSGACRPADCGFVYSNPREKDPEGYNDENNAALKDKYVAKQYSKRHQRRYGKLLKRFERYRRQGRILDRQSEIKQGDRLLSIENGDG